MHLLPLKRQPISLWTTQSKRQLSRLKKVQRQLKRLLLTLRKRQIRLFQVQGIMLLTSPMKRKRQQAKLLTRLKRKQSTLLKEQRLWLVMFLKKPNRFLMNLSARLMLKRKAKRNLLKSLMLSLSHLRRTSFLFMKSSLRLLKIWMKMWILPKLRQTRKTLKMN